MCRLVTTPLNSRALPKPLVTRASRGRTHSPLQRRGVSWLFRETATACSYSWSILAWSATALYPFYEQTPRIWGLSPVEDQNVGGVIMMVEQSFTLVLVMVALFVRMLAQSEEEERRRERLADRETIVSSAADEPGASPGWP